MSLPLLEMRSERATRERDAARDAARLLRSCLEDLLAEHPQEDLEVTLAVLCAEHPWLPEKENE